MRWDTLRRALELRLRSEKRRFDFFFSGGEPLLEFGLIRRAVEYLEKRRRSALDHRYSLSTNGALLTPAISSFLEEHLFTVQISFDGVVGAQDLRSRGGFLVLDKILDRLRLSHKELFEHRLRIHITISAPGVRFLADSVAYLIQKDCRQISMGVAFSPTVPDISDVREELSSQFARILHMSLEHYRLSRAIPVVVFKREGPRKKPVERRFVCSMQNLNGLTVDTDGDAYACALFAQSYQKLPSKFLEDQVRPLDLGPIDAPDFGEKCARLPEVAANLPIFLNTSEKHSSYLRCSDCSYQAECEVCPVSIGHIPGNTDPDRRPDFLCAYNQVLIEHQRLFSDRCRAVGDGR